jgi:DNA replication protein DnaC
MERLENMKDGLKEQKISLSATFPNFYERVKDLNLTDEIIEKYIKYFEEGEEILERCKERRCEDCLAVVPSFEVLDGKIYPTYEPCKMYYYRRTRDKLKDFIIEIPTHKSFKNFTITKEIEGAINLVNNFLKNELYKKVKGIFFYGPPGTGKTHLSYALLNEINQKTNTFSFAIFVPEFIQKIRDYYSQGEVELNPINEIAKIPVLLVDDLGAERYTEWVQEQIVQLLDFRYRNNLSTIITSNLNLKKLEEKVGERIYSRVIGLCKPVLIYGKDFRKKQQDW